MEASIKLGRVFGVEIGLHYTWFIIAFLISISIFAHLSFTNPLWAREMIWLVAVITALFFFLAILVHEMSHALVAKAYGIPVRSITLFALGGLANIEKDAAKPSAEFFMGIVGPITSFVIGAACLSIAWALGWSPFIGAKTPAMAALVWLGYINVLLAMFNMIPGFPLDGGRILRALIWWMTDNAERATRIASRVGLFVGFVFIALGLFRFLTGAGFGGLWLALIGWFLSDAAQMSYTQSRLTSSLKGVKAREIMSTDSPHVAGDTTLQSFVDDYLLHSGHRFFTVTGEADDDVIGIITPKEVAQVERKRWSETSVAEAMKAMSALSTVSPDTPVSDALEEMAKKNINQVPVVSNSKMIGTIDRSSILNLFRAHSELGV